MTHTERVINEFKRRAIFFPKGRIVPRWVLRFEKPHHKMTSCIKFGDDCWVLPQGANGVCVAADYGCTAIYGKTPKRFFGASIKAKGSPYGGKLNFILNTQGNDDAWSKAMFNAMQGGA